MIVADGILEDLNGAGCPACKRGALKSGYCDDPVLGEMKGKDAADIHLRTVWYRCKRCRARVPVTYGHPLFPKSLHGGEYNGRGNSIPRCCVGQDKLCLPLSVSFNHLVLAVAAWCGGALVFFFQVAQTM